jgi:hypothetical protein
MISHTRNIHRMQSWSLALRNTCSSQSAKIFGLGVIRWGVYVSCIVAKVEVVKLCAALGILPTEPLEASGAIPITNNTLIEVLLLIRCSCC